MRLRRTYYAGDYFVYRGTIRAFTWDIWSDGLESSVVCSAANYDTKGPHDHEFFSELSILEKNLSAIFVTSTICLSEADCETGFPSIDYPAWGKVHGKASSIDHK